jgi:hypothetical protein
MKRLLVLASVILFVLAALGVEAPISLGWLGLAVWAGSTLV